MQRRVQSLQIDQVSGDDVGCQLAPEGQGPPFVRAGTDNTHQGGDHIAPVHLFSYARKDERLGQDAYVRRIVLVG